MNDHSSGGTDESVENSLRDIFKLASYEARVYVALLKQGKQNPKQLSSMSQVPLPRIYDTLESLMAKGFVVLAEDGSYEALPARQALRGRSKQFEQQFSQEQEQREKAVEVLSKSLAEISLEKERTGGSSSPGEISILKGFNSIANKFTELLEDSSEIILVAKRAIEAKEVFIPILLDLGMQHRSVTGTGATNPVEQKRAQGMRSGRPETSGIVPGKRMRIRILVPRSAAITKEEVRQSKAANAEIRRSDHILFDMMITYSDDVIIGVPDPLSEEINHAIAIWVKNSSFARSTRNSMEEIWKSAEKV